MIAVIRLYSSVYRLKLVSRLANHGYHYVRAQVNERFVEKEKFQMNLITLLTFLEAIQIKNMLTPFLFFIRAVSVFLFPKMS